MQHSCREGEAGGCWVEEEQDHQGELRVSSSFSLVSSWGLRVNRTSDLKFTCLVSGASWGSVSNLINKIDKRDCGVWETNSCTIVKLARTSVSLSKAVLLIFMDLEAWVVWVNIPLPAPCHQCSTDGCGVAHCSLNTCYNASLCHFFISSIDGSAGFHLAVNFYWKQFSSFLCPFCLTSERKSQSLEVWVFGSEEWS